MSEESSMDIDYVANLARIELTSQEKEKFQGQLGDVLKYFEKLQEVDVKGVEPTAHAHPVENVWREGDEPGPVYEPQTLTRMAPESRDNQIVVPKVVE